MKSFSIQGEHNEFIRINLNDVHGYPETTSVFGGYDVEGTTEINSGSYSVKGGLWFTTGEVYLFAEQLVQVYKACSGTAAFHKTLEQLQEITGYYGGMPGRYGA